jgi:hypothetical protein
VTRKAYEHEAADEGPGEVGALPRVDVERPAELPQRPRGLVRLGQPAIVQRDREEQDEEPADRARRQEHREQVAREQRDQERAAHRRDGHADPQDTCDHPALGGGNLVRKDRNLGGEQCVEEELGGAPSEQDDRDGGCQRDDADAQGTAHQAEDHPWPPHAHLPGRSVAHLAEERVAEHRDQGADAGDEREAVRCLFDPHERVDLQSQGDQHRREEEQAGAHVRQRVQRDEAPSDPMRRDRPGSHCRLDRTSVLRSKLRHGALLMEVNGLDMARGAIGGARVR